MTVSITSRPDMQPWVAQSRSTSLPAPPTTQAAEQPDQLRETFDDFVGQTFFGLMLQSMRKTVGEPAYFGGSRAEEIFRGQLDQVLTEKLSDASAQQFSDPMYELFLNDVQRRPR